MNNIYNKNGSFMVFMCILLSTLIFIMGVLLNASKYISQKTTFKALLVNEHDYLLSEYSEILLDRYGMFATSVPMNKNMKFENLFDNNEYEVGDFEVRGISELKEEVLYNAIIDFCAPRFPVSFSSDILKRVLLITDVIGTLKPKTNYTNTNPNYQYNEFNYYKILNLIKSLNVSKYLNHDQIPDEFSFEEVNRMLINYENDSMFEPQVMTNLKNTLTIDSETVNSLFNNLDNIIDFDTPQWYEKIVFEHYINRMFSCKTNFVVEDGNKLEFKDLRSRNFSDMYSFDKSEIEKIIFGFEDTFTNEFLTKMSIQSMRTIIHIISFLSDKTKYATIKIASVAYCSIVSIATAGSVVVPPEVMDVVMLILFSTTAATLDYLNLINGNEVKLIPHKTQTNISTYYKDYLFLLQLMVSKENKLDRISTIIKQNTNNSGFELFTKILVSARYKNEQFHLAGGYYD